MLPATGVLSSCHMTHNSGCCVHVLTQVFRSGCSTSKLFITLPCLRPCFSHSWLVPLSLFPLTQILNNRARTSPANLAHKCVCRTSLLGSLSAMNDSCLILSVNLFMISNIHIHFLRWGFGELLFCGAVFRGNRGNNLRFDWFICFTDLSCSHEPSLPS